MPMHLRPTLLLGLLAFFAAACTRNPSAPPTPGGAPSNPEAPPPKVALDHWKLQLPDRSLDDVEPSELEERTRNGELRPYFYYDDEGALVFFTLPLDTTAHSRYSRTELREQLVPGRDDVNWTLQDGGVLRGRLAVAAISHDGDGRAHRTIVMQIHGRLSDAQAARIGADDHDAPPLLKVYWQRGQVRLLFKKLRDPGADDEEILHKSAWTDDEPFVFPEHVDHGPFELRVEARPGRVRVALNGEAHDIATPSLVRWPFENYFKAGNYLQTRDDGAQATVVFYELAVDHP